MRNNAEVLHGDIAQKQREVTLKRFKESKFNVLVATDVAARGLDIPNVDLVIQLEPPKEIETYIHRSGRTARAGKEGISITFYTGREYQTIQDIEYSAGIKFKKIDPPKNEDIIKVSSVDVIENLKEVDKKILPFFEDAAQKFIDEVGAKEALCMALAYISDASKAAIGGKSYITGEEGVITYILKSDREVRSSSYGYKTLQNFFSEEVSSQCKGVRILRNGEGIAFDISEDAAELLDAEFKEAACTKRGLPFTLERASDIPQFEDDNKYGKSGGFSKGYQGRGGFNTQRNFKSDYNRPYTAYNNGGDKGDSFKTSDVRSKAADKYEKSDDSAFNFRNKPTFTNSKGGDSWPDNHSEHGYSTKDYANDNNSSRGGRGGRGFGAPRGGPRGRGAPRARGRGGF